MKKFKITDLIHPKTAFFFAVVPFMFLCPLAMSIIFTGYPLNIWSNNIKINRFNEVFSAIEMPEEVTSKGQVKGFIGGFNNDAKNECDLLSATIITSAADGEELGKKLLKNFTGVFDYRRISNDSLKLARTGQLFIIPLGSVHETYSNGLIRIDVSKLINDSLDLSEENKPYLLYMVNYDVFSSSDKRCVARSV